MRQVVERLEILPYPRGLGNIGVIIQKRKLSMRSHSFQDTELKLRR